MKLFGYSMKVTSLKAEIAESPLPSPANRRCDRLKFLPVILAVFGSLASSASGKSAAERPNIIVVMPDQYRADLCGAYGGGKNITTPNIDRLAREGITFDNALAICPLCTPARAMFMTGLYGSHTGMVLNFLQINPDQPAIAKAFDQAGYETGIIGKWHLAAGDRIAPGKFNEDGNAIRAYDLKHPNYDYVPPGPERLGFEYWAAYNFQCDFMNEPYYRDEPVVKHMKGFETDAEIDMAMAFIREQIQAGRPFFLFVAPHPPHPPFRPDFCPPGYLEHIPTNLVWSPNVPKDARRRTNTLAIRCYYAMAKNFDDNLGRLLRFLDETGLATNTIVEVTSDHGEMNGSHNRNNKMVPYAEAVKVPMIARWPGHIPAGVHTKTLQTHADQFPTLCALAGIPVPKHRDGIDLSRVYLGKGKVKRDAVLMMSYSSHWDYFQTGTRWPEWRGVKTERYTYVKWLKGREELYDDVADPYQMTNLVQDAGHHATLEKLRARLKKLLKQADDQFLPGTAYANWYDDNRNLIPAAFNASASRH